MSTTVKVPARGQAWLGDWHARVVDRLRVRGFGSVTEFGESRPRVSLLELATELSTDDGIDRSDVAAEQLLRVWRGEAQTGGPGAVERFARRTLVGELCRDLPGGWRADWTLADSETKAAASRLALTTGRWIAYLDDKDEDAGNHARSWARWNHSRGLASCERGRSFTGGDLPQELVTRLDSTRARPLRWRGRTARVAR
jgi:hypothetical protein